MSQFYAIESLLNFSTTMCFANSKAQKSWYDSAFSPKNHWLWSHLHLWHLSVSHSTKRSEKYSEALNILPTASYRTSLQARASRWLRWNLFIFSAVLTVELLNSPPIIHQRIVLITKAQWSFIATVIYFIYTEICPVSLFKCYRQEYLLMQDLLQGYSPKFCHQSHMTFFLLRNKKEILHYTGLL